MSRKSCHPGCQTPGRTPDSFVRARNVSTANSNSLERMSSRCTRSNKNVYNWPVVSNYTTADPVVIEANPGCHFPDFLPVFLPIDSGMPNFALLTGSTLGRFYRGPVPTISIASITPAPTRSIIQGLLTPGLGPSVRPKRMKPLTSSPKWSLTVAGRSNMCVVLYRNLPTTSHPVLQITPSR